MVDRYTQKAIVEQNRERTKMMSIVVVIIVPPICISLHKKILLGKKKIASFRHSHFPFIFYVVMF